MSDITQYFDDLERQVRELQGVASMKTVSAERTAPGVEEREYEVYLKSGADSSFIADTLKRDFRVKSVEEKSDYILVEDSFAE